MESSLKDQKPYIFHRSRSLFKRTVLNILFILGVIGITCTLFYESYINHFPISDDFLRKWVGMIIIFGFILFLMIGSFIKWLQSFLKDTKPIILNSNSISIGSDVIPFSEIKGIKTIDIGYIDYERFYGASINLLNGKTKFIAEQFYEEAPALFQTLENISQHHFPENEFKTEGQQFNHETEKEERFDFNIFTSIEHLLTLSLLLIVLFGLFKFLFYADHPVYYTYFLLALSIIIYYLNIRFSYYFVIDSHNFEIRNKFLFSFSKVYRLSEIKAAIIHTQGMGRSIQFGIRIVMKNYQTFYFASNAFNKKKWQSLSETLHRRGIHVQNKIS